jgi:hypothetical protein
VLLLLAMAGGRLIAATCEVACLIGPSASRAAQSQQKGAAAHCHEPAPESAASSAQIAQRGRHGCHDTATPTLVLTSPSVRTALESGDLALSGRQQTGPADVSARRARQPHSPPGLHRSPIVPLRI